MDPLSIAASIVALCSAADIVRKFAISAYRTSKRVKGAKEEIGTFSKNVRLYGDLIMLASRALEPFDNPDSQQPPVILYLSKHQVLDQLIEQSKYLMGELGGYIPKIIDLRDIPGWLVRLKWTLQKKEIDALSPKMESLKCSFNLVLNSVLLEKIRLLPRTQSNNREIKRLRFALTCTMEDANRVQEKLESQPARYPGGADDSFLSLGRQIKVALVDLSTSLVKERRVPGFPPTRSSPTSSSVYTAPQSPINTIDTTRSSTSPTSAQHSSTTFTASNVTPTRNRRRQKRAVSSPTSTVRNRQPLEPTPENSPNASNQCAPSAVNTVSRPAPVSQFLSVYENTNLLRVNLSQNSRGEIGYLTTPSGPAFVTALVDQDLSENFITQSYAVRHGLEIDLLDDDAEEGEEGGIWISIGNGKLERCVGKVKLEWSKGPLSRKRPFPVYCWVCVHRIWDGDVTFGRRFLEKKDYYWGNSGRV